MKNFREKVIQGFAWNSVNVLFGQILSLTIHIILARLLIPEHFGIIGMISIFTELALRIQGAGLGESLIRKKNVSPEEYNFVFFYGLSVGTSFYLLLFFLAPFISDFYVEPQLTWIIRVITINLVLVPLRGMNRVQLMKNLDFKGISIIETSTTLFSGIVAIYFAYKGYGVWSLVIQAMCQHVIAMTLFFLYNRWIPSFAFDKQKSKALFSIGSKFMIANFLQIGFRDIYNVIIGKQYSASSLGFYMQGMKLQKLPSNAVNTMIKNVSFPAFAEVKNDKANYKRAFGKTMRLLTYINFTILIGLAAIADPLIPTVFSEKWRATIPFFQILVMIGVLDPIKSLFGNILKVEGKGEVLIKYVFFTKLFYLIGIFLVIEQGIYALIISQVIAAFLELLVFSTIGKTIDYTGHDFLKDVVPNLCIALTVGTSLLLLNGMSPIRGFPLLFIDTIVGIITLYCISNITKNPSFMEIKTEISNRFLK